MEQIQVPFHAADTDTDATGGSHQRRGAPSWGQREVWGVGGQLGRHVTLGGLTALPCGTTVESVAESFAGLMARHPTLRTLFRVDEAGRLREQLIPASGEIPITLIDADEPEQAAFDTAVAFDQARFDCGTEWPIRMAVVRHRGAPTHMVAVYNHIALDARGLDAMLATLVNRAAPPTPPSPSPLSPSTSPTPSALPPLAQAHWQQSVAGQRQSNRALRYWSRALRQAPSRQFRDQRADRDAPYVKLVLESEAAGLAVQAISERTRQSSGHILLAAYATAVAHLSGSPNVAARVVVDNRFRPGLSDSVSTVSQMGLWVIDVSATTFDTMLARALTASLDAYMNAYYDPEGRQLLLDSVERERGQPIVLDCCYNDRRRAGSTGTASSNKHTDLHSALERSVLRWEPWTAPTKPAGETFYVHVDDAPTGSALVFTVCGDTAYLAAAQIEQCARMIEDTLVRAALDVGTPLPALRRAAVPQGS